MKQCLFLVLYVKTLHGFLNVLFTSSSIYNFELGSIKARRFLQLQANTGCAVRYSTQASLLVLVPCRTPWQKDTHRMAQRYTNWKILSKLTPRNRLTTPPKETVKYKSCKITSR